MCMLYTSLMFLLLNGIPFMKVPQFACLLLEEVIETLT